MIVLRAQCTHCSFKLETGQTYEEVVVTPELLLLASQDHASLEHHMVLWSGYAVENATQEAAK